MGRSLAACQRPVKCASARGATLATMARAKRESGGAPPGGQRCPSCGAETAADARFCAQCGVRLAGLSGAAEARRRRHARLPPRVERGFGAVAASGEPNATIEYLKSEDWVPIDSALVNVSRG